MDIDRLKKIKQICFNTKGKRQPSQNARAVSKSPIDTMTIDSLKNTNKENNNNIKPKANVVNQQSKSPIKRRIGENGKNQDLLKKYENELIMAYKTKQGKLEQNMKIFNEAAQKKKEVALQQANQDRISRKSMSPPRARSQSPQYHYKGMTQGFIAPQNNYLSNQYAQNHHSMTRPFSNENKQNQKSILKSLGSTSQFGMINPVFTELKGDQYDQKVVELREMMLNLVNLLQPQNNLQRPLIQENEIDEIRLKLLGSFERVQYNQTSDKKEQLLQVLDSCFNDLFYKISSQLHKQHPSFTTENLPQVEQLIFNLFEQLTASSLEDAIPQISSAIFELRLDLSCLKIQSTLNQKTKQVQQQSFQALKQYSNSKSFLNMSVKHVVIKCLKKIQNTKTQRSFQLWSDSIKKETQSINQLINLHHQVLMKQLISSSADPEGMTFYYEQVRIFLGQVLKMKASEIEIVLADSYQSDENSSITYSDKQNLIFPVHTSKQNRFGQRNLIFNIKIACPSILPLNVFKAYDGINKTGNHQIASKKIIMIIQKVTPLLVDAWKSFKKLNKQFQSFNDKLEAVNNMSMVNDKTLQQMQYLQNKSCELNLVATICDNFKIMEIIVKELLNYDKCHIFAYTQGNINKIYDASKGGSIRQEIGSVNEEDTIGDQQIRELVTSQIEGKSYLFTQDLQTQEDPFELNRQVNKDYVMIQLEPSSMDLSQSVISQINQSFIVQQQNVRYYIQLEKVVKRIKDQEKFENKCDIQTVLKNFIQICLIAINKILIIANSQPVLETESQLQEESKMFQENENLKRIIDVNRQIDFLINEIKQNNLVSNYDGLQAKIALFVKENITNSQFVKLFISNDGGQGVGFYTYPDYENHAYQPSSRLNFKLNSLTNEKQQKGSIGAHKVISSQFNVQNPHNLYKQTRSRSQLDGPYHNNNFPSHIDDISSISGGDTNNTPLNANEKNSLLLNGFQFDSTHLNQQQAPQPLSRDPSSQLLMSQHSNNNIKKNINSKFSKQLYRDNSVQSDLQANQQRKFVSNITDLICEEPSSFNIKDKKRAAINHNSSFHEILNELTEEDFEIVSTIQNSHNNKIHVRPFDRPSIMGQALQYKRGLIKKNAKNDKMYCHHVDGLILSGIDPPAIVENLLYEVILSSNHDVQGVIQLANSEKEKCFEEDDLELMRILCLKLGNLIQESKENHNKKQLFKKQLEVSVINTSLENQTVNKVLSLANKLFQSNLPPYKTTSLFLQKAEKYLNKIFNCQESQILMIDNNKNQFFSFDSCQKNQLTLRGGLDEISIAGYIVSANFSGAFVFPQATDYILINDDSYSGGPNIPTNQINPQYFNTTIDIPLTNQANQTTSIPSSYLALTIRSLKDEKVLAILQLINKANSSRFSESDVKHASLVGEHLAQVFTYINSPSYLKQFTLHQQQAVGTIMGTLSKKHKNHQKQFFRELLAFKMGKINMLKNKIIRKNLDKHYQIDQALVEKMARLQTLSEKFTKKTKQTIIQKFRQKLIQINNYRKQNGKQCMKIMQKYDKILAERVKDTAFRSWFNQHKNGINSSFNSNSMVFQATFNANQSISGYSHNNMSILEESSITSVLYHKAKAIYKMRKLFNRSKLQVYFICFYIKSVGAKKNALRRISNEKMIKVLMLRQLISERIKSILASQFKKFQSILESKAKKQNALKRLSQRRHQKLLTFGVQNWHSQSEQSIRRELREERSYTSQLNEQCKDATLLQTIISKSNSIIAESMARNSNNNGLLVDELLLNCSMQQLLNSLAEQVLQHHLQADSIVLTLNIPNDTRCLMFSYRAQEGESLFQQDGGISHFLSVTAPHQPSTALGEGASEVKQNLHQPNISQLSISQFASFQELFHLRNQSPAKGHQQHLQNNNEDDSEIIQQPQFPIFKIIGNNDVIVQSLMQTQQAFIVNNLQNDEILQDSLNVRNMQDCKQAMVLPIRSSQNVGEVEILGSIEVYMRDNSVHFSYEDQCRFKQHAITLYTGMQPLIKHIQMLQKVQKAQQLNDLHNIQLNAQPQYFHEMGEGQHKISTLKTLAQFINSSVSSIFKADHCQLFYIYGQNHYGIRKGLCYNTEAAEGDDPYCNLVDDLDFKGTMLEEMVQYNTFRQLTLPSSLLCKDQYFSQQVLRREQRENLNAIDGNSYEAIKYLPISMKNKGEDQLVAIIEIGWSNYLDAELIHEQNYIQRREHSIKELIVNHISSIKQQMGLFLLTISKKINSQNLATNGRRMFNLWKQLYFIQPPYTSANQYERHSQSQQLSQLQQSHQQNTFDYRNQTVSQHYSPIQPKQLTKNFMTERHLHEHAPSSPYSNLYIPSKLKLVDPNTSNQKSPLKSQQFQQELVPAEQLNVEIMAKRKLIAAAFVMINLSERVAKKRTMQYALCQWKAFCERSQVTECAFNKLLEINHRHSYARYYAATHILGRLFNKGVAVREAVDKIKSQTMRIGFTFKSQLNSELLQEEQSLNYSDDKYNRFNAAIKMIPVYQTNQTSINDRAPYNEYSPDLSRQQDSNNLKPPSHSKVFSMGAANMRTQQPDFFNLDQYSQRKQVEEQAADDESSEFSLGKGTKDLIQVKADQILKNARNQHKLDSFR